MTLVDDEEVIVLAHEVIEDDLVVFAPYVRVDGLVKGDLSVVGSDVVVEGIVEQDLLVAAKTLYLNGSVGDDARVAVYAAAFGESAVVADDVFAAAYSVETKPGSRAGGALFAATRQLRLAGQVVEDLRARAGALELAGLVGGSVHAVVGGLQGVTHSSLVVDLALEIPVIPEGLTVTESAAIGGDLDHRSETAAISAGASIGGRLVAEPWDDAATPPPAADGEAWLPDAGPGALDRLAVLLVLGLLLAAAAPGFLMDRADDARARPLDLLGWGLGTCAFALLLLVVLGAAFFVLLAVGVTSGLGGLAFAALFGGGLVQATLVALFLLAIVYLAPLLASAALGRAIAARIPPARIEPPDGPVAAMLALALGAIAYTALRAIPWLGPVLGFVAALIGLGAIATWARSQLGPSTTP